MDRELLRQHMKLAPIPIERVYFNEKISNTQVQTALFHSASDTPIVPEAVLCLLRDIVFVLLLHIFVEPFYFNVFLIDNGSYTW